MKILLYIVIIGSLFAFNRCAQQMAPSGGERDFYAPILDTNKASPAVPANFSTNFNSDEIVLTFNEYFALNDPVKNILITPILKQNPIYRIKGKKLIISLGEELKKNTTYTINFGEAIKDITEGNISKNFNYIFSTGDYIDSLSFNGRVYDGYTKAGVGDVTFMLYEDKNDSIPFTGKPMYFVKTSINGSFNMNYLKAGTYKAIALLDDNNDYQFNPKTESIAFVDKLIEIPEAESDTLENRFLLFAEDLKRQYVVDKIYSHKGKVSLVMNRTSDDLEVKGVDGLDLNTERITYSPEKDSIEFWIDSNQIKNKSILVSVFDKTNDFTDTVKIAIVTPKNGLVLPLIVSTKAKKGLDKGSDLHILFNKPLAAVDDSKIKIERNDEEVAFEVAQDKSKEVIISSNWEPGKNYSCTIYPEAFTSMFGETTDTIAYSFKYKEEKDYGKLLLKMELEEGHYVLQLMQGGKVVSQKFFDGKSYKFDFTQLNPGKYELKLTYDKNNNGKWDTGDYLNHLQPERVEFYNEEISIRQGWDVDVTWKIK